MHVTHYHLQIAENAASTLLQIQKLFMSAEEETQIGRAVCSAWHPGTPWSKYFKLPESGMTQPTQPWDECPQVTRALAG